MTDDADTGTDRGLVVATDAGAAEVTGAVPPAPGPPPTGASAPPATAPRRTAKSSRSGRGRAARSTRTGLVYGPAALVAAARDDRLFWALHQAALVRGLVPVVPSLVVSEAARVTGDPAVLADVLAGTEVEPLDGERAAVLGALAATSGSDNLVTVATVETAARRRLAAVSERSSRLGEIAATLDHDLILHAL